MDEQQSRKHSSSHPSPSQPQTYRSPSQQQPFSSLQPQQQPPSMTFQSKPAGKPPTDWFDNLGNGSAGAATSSNIKGKAASPTMVTAGGFPIKGNSSTSGTASSIGSYTPSQMRPNVKKGDDQPEPTPAIARPPVPIPSFRPPQPPTITDEEDDAVEEATPLVDDETPSFQPLPAPPSILLSTSTKRSTTSAALTTINDELEPEHEAVKESPYFADVDDRVSVAASALSVSSFHPHESFESVTSLTPSQAARARPCPRCEKRNDTEANFCARCGLCIGLGRKAEDEVSSKLGELAITSENAPISSASLAAEDTKEEDRSGKESAKVERRAFPVFRFGPQSTFVHIPLSTTRRPGKRQPSGNAIRSRLADQPAVRTRLLKEHRVLASGEDYVTYLDSLPGPLAKAAAIGMVSPSVDAMRQGIAIYLHGLSPLPHSDISSKNDANLVPLLLGGTLPDFCRRSAASSCNWPLALIASKHCGLWDEIVCQLASQIPIQHPLRVALDILEERVLDFGSMPLEEDWPHILGVLVSFNRLDDIHRLSLALRSQRNARMTEPAILAAMLCSRLDEPLCLLNASRMINISAAWQAACDKLETPNCFDSHIDMYRLLHAEQMHSFGMLDPKMLVDIRGLGNASLRARLQALKQQTESRAAFVDAAVEVDFTSTATFPAKPVFAPSGKTQTEANEGGDEFKPAISSDEGSPPPTAVHSSASSTSAATHSTSAATHPTSVATHPTSVATHPKSVATHSTSAATHSTSAATHSTSAATHPIVMPRPVRPEFRPVPTTAEPVHPSAKPPEFKPATSTGAPALRPEFRPVQSPSTLQASQPRRQSLDDYDALGLGNKSLQRSASPTPSVSSARGADETRSTSGSVFSRVRSWFSSSKGAASGGSLGDGSANKSSKANLGEASTFRYDEALGRWVDEADGTKGTTAHIAPPPPPMASSGSSLRLSDAGLKSARSRYVDVMMSSSRETVGSMTSPALLSGQSRAADTEAAATTSPPIIPMPSSMTGAMSARPARPFMPAAPLTTAAEGATSAYEPPSFMPLMADPIRSAQTSTAGYGTEPQGQQQPMLSAQKPTMRPPAPTAATSTSSTSATKPLSPITPLRSPMPALRPQMPSTTSMTPVSAASMGSSARNPPHQATHASSVQRDKMAPPKKEDIDTVYGML